MKTFEGEITFHQKGFWLSQNYLTAKSTPIIKARATIIIAMLS